VAAVRPLELVLHAGAARPAQLAVVAAELAALGLDGVLQPDAGQPFGKEQANGGLSEEQRDERAEQQGGRPPPGPAQAAYLRLTSSVTR
jgi:hypothetical protein